MAIRFLLYSAIVLLFWDSLCTFDVEVKIIWRTKFTLGAWFYLITRYGTLLSLVIDFFSFYLPSSNCIVLDTVASWTTIILTLGFHGLLTLRTYAISGRKLYVLVPLLAIYIGRFVEQVISFATVISFCKSPSQKLIDDNIRENIANTVFNLTAESIAFVVTTHATYGNWSFFRKQGSGSADKNLSTMIFEQGAITYGIIVMIPVVTKILTKIFPERADVITSALPFSSILPTIVTCRFFLSLRRRNLHRISLSRPYSLRMTELQFGRFSTSQPRSQSRSRSNQSWRSRSRAATISSIQQQIINEFGDPELTAPETDPVYASLLAMSPVQEEADA